MNNSEKYLLKRIQKLEHNDKILKEFLRDSTELHKLTDIRLKALENHINPET